MINDIISFSTTKERNMNSKFQIYIISEHWEDTDKIKEKYKDDVAVQEAVVISDPSVLIGLEKTSYEVWDIRRLSVEYARLGIEPLVMF